MTRHIVMLFTLGAVIAIATAMWIGYVIGARDGEAAVATPHAARGFGCDGGAVATGRPAGTAMSPQRATTAPG
jgi:hypothetical protein